MDHKWGRLKDVKVDPLESVGLPSKGDNRLLAFSAQEAYYDEILKRYEQLHVLPDKPLEEALSSLCLEQAEALKNPESTTSLPRQREHSILMQAMRKIREAIVASARADDFARDAYVFIIRATIHAKHMESYHPALLHLLYRIHPVNPLPARVFLEFVGYYILDLACRQGDLAQAFAVRHLYCVQDQGIDAVLKALVTGDWCSFWQAKEMANSNQRRLMEWADERVRKHALQCLGKAYLTAEKTYVERAAQRSWEDLKELDHVGWELSGTNVKIKRIQRR